MNFICGSSRVHAAANALTAELAGIFLDYSKNRITDETVKLL
jgi:hypothetical protein